MCIKINKKVAFLIYYSRTKKSKYCCHPPFHPPIFCRHSSKLLSPTLPKLMNWILLSPPQLSSDPDNPPKFGTCTNNKAVNELKVNFIYWKVIRVFLHSAHRMAACVHFERHLPPSLWTMVLQTSKSVYHLNLR